MLSSGDHLKTEKGMWGWALSAEHEAKGSDSQYENDIWAEDVYLATSTYATQP